MAYVLGPVRPHVKAVAETVGKKYNVSNVIGFGQRDRESDHPLGLALDFMVGNDNAKGDAVAADLRSNATAYGITYVIWEQQIWSTARAGEGWRRMADRGSNTANHMDHVHVSFSATPGSGVPKTSSGFGCVMLFLATTVGIASAVVEQLVR